MNSRRAMNLAPMQKKKDDVTIEADTTSILSRLEKFYRNLLYVHHSSSLEGNEICTAEPSLLEAEQAVEK